MSTGETLVAVLQAAPAVLTALAALIVALKGKRIAHEARDRADQATDQAREAAKEQINFALRSAARSGRAVLIPSAPVSSVDIAPP